MAEQAQSDADDLDGLQEVALDATQDPTDPSTNGPYAKLIQELQQPATPLPQPPPPHPRTAKPRCSSNRNVPSCAKTC